MAAERFLIWVVDDDDDVRDALATLLVDAGFEVRSFENGAVAWSALVDVETRPSAIVIDNHMPLMDGVEFRRRQLAAADLADIPVIIYTASGPLVVPGALVVSKRAHIGVLLSAPRVASADRERGRTQPTASVSGGHA